LENNEFLSLDSALLHLDEDTHPWKEVVLLLWLGQGGRTAAVHSL